MNLFSFSLSRLTLTGVTLGLSLALSGCGDSESGEKSKREFGQDVRLINYRLKQLSVDLSLLSPAGGKENLEKVLNYAPDESKDHLQRKIEDAEFTLVINEKKAPIKLSTSGKLQRSETISGQTKTCSLDGKSTITGSAENLEIALDWTLELTLKGENCDENMRKRFIDFQNSEVENLNLQAVRDLLSATDRAREQTQSIKLRMKIRGDGF